MSDHHHDHSHSSEKKPVSFTVPFILASVTLLAIIMFLSLCDPKPHHGASHEECSEECTGPCNEQGGSHHAMEAKAEETHSDNADTEKATEEKAAEAPATEEHH